MLALQTLLASHGRNLSDFQLPTPTDELPVTQLCDDQRDADAGTYHAANLPLLNIDQRHVYDTVCQAIDSNNGGAFFLDAPGGTGKTFVLNVILSYVRQKDEIALAVAGSGIAATLLKLGRTAHSRLKLPIPADENSTCNVTLRSATAELLRHTRLIVWDEAPMAHRYLLEALNRTLCDVLNNQKSFGGLTLLMTGDFRQILPVIRHGCRAEIVDSALSRSTLWNIVTKLKLHRNVRVEKCARDKNHIARLHEHAEWLMQLGDGKLPPTPEGTIYLPTHLCVPTTQHLVDFVFAEINSKSDDVAWVSNRAILCPRNDTVDRMNERVLDMFPGDTITCLSVDTVAEADQQANYPVEYLNSLNLSGLPPHSLQIKISAPIMLLRNMDSARGHCNGTRYIVRHISKRYIVAEITGGE